MTLWMVRLPNVEVEPTLPPNVIEPVPAVKSSACDPSSVLENAMFPAPAPLDSVVLPNKVTGSAKVIF